MPCASYICIHCRFLYVNMNVPNSYCTLLLFLWDYMWDVFYCLLLTSTWCNSLISPRFASNISTAISLHYLHIYFITYCEKLVSANFFIKNHITYVDVYAWPHNVTSKRAYSCERSNLCASRIQPCICERIFNVDFIVLELSIPNQKQSNCSKLF